MLAYSILRSQKYAEPLNENVFPFFSAHLHCFSKMDCNEQGAGAVLWDSQ